MRTPLKKSGRWFVVRMKTFCEYNLENAGRLVRLAFLDPMERFEHGTTQWPVSRPRRRRIGG
jgi:hypothetical protein